MTKYIENNIRNYELGLIILCSVLLFFTINADFPHIFLTVTLSLSAFYFFPFKLLVIKNDIKAKMISDLLMCWSFSIVSVLSYVPINLLSFIFVLLNFIFMIYLYFFISDKQILTKGEYRVMILFHFLVMGMLSVV